MISRQNIANAGGDTAAGMTSKPVLLDVHDMSKRFGATQALNGVSTSFRKGEIHCLLGENGAGKSTLGKILAGLVRADTGEIRLRGTPVSFRRVEDARAHGIEMVFQELSLANHLRVQDNICLGREKIRFPLSLIDSRSEVSRCRELLADLDLDVDLDTMIGHLPTAAKQLVEIAKALYRGPDVIVLDEPTAMLGATEKRQLFSVIERLKAKGKTFIFITHHIEEVIEFGDRVSIMKDGELLESFPLTPDITSDFIVERLAGRRVETASRAAIAQAKNTDVVLTIRDRSTGADFRTREITIRRGEIVGLYGVASCGSEAVAASVVGLGERPGIEMHLQGEPYRPRSPADAARAGVAYLPAGRADNGVLPSLSIQDNLMVAQLRLMHRFGLVDGRAERAQALEQLSHLGVKFRDAGERITALSGGNQQKVLVGRVMSYARHLLVLENPTAGIDIAAKQEVHRLIRAKTEADGVAVLLLSGEVNETLTLCDAIYTVFDGAVVNRYESPAEGYYHRILADILGDNGTASKAEDH